MSASADLDTKSPGFAQVDIVMAASAVTRGVDANGHSGLPEPGAERSPALAVLGEAMHQQRWRAWRARERTTAQRLRIQHHLSILAPLYSDAVPINEASRGEPSTNATFCATLVDQWIQDGITHAFVAPGSRSTPLALALADDDRLAVEVFHDERSAAFAALGVGLSTGRPAVIVCTSGTAGAHFFAAIIEADLSAVPLIACTADRPPELWNRGAPQTIDQHELFGNKVRRAFAPGPPDDLDAREWRRVARAAVAAATGAHPGPVQLNLSFREPLVGAPGPLPPEIAPAAEGVETVRTDLAPLVARLAGQRGVIICGRNQSNAEDIVRLAELLGWPLIADHRSGCRTTSRSVINRFDSLLRDESTAHHLAPDVVVRLGEIVSSKAVSQWLSSLDADVIASQPWGRTIDPEDIVDTFVDEADLLPGLVHALEAHPAALAPTGWLDAWARADELGEAAVVAKLADVERSEPGVARAVVAAVPVDGALVLASSMPVRDVEWFGPPRSDISVYSNRGANGIDGTIATAIGVALTGVPTWCLIGDVAFLHDSTSLIAINDRDIDLTIVVVDNDGGGIFSFLPQRHRLNHDRYEQLFGTPHDVDLATLCAAHGITAIEYAEALSAGGGVRVIIASTDRDQNLRLHDALHANVAAALANNNS